LESSKSGSISGNEAITDELRKETTLLKSRIEGLEKELMSQESELKAAKASLKDKNNDPMVKNLQALFQQFSLHLNDMQGVQKDMDKIFQLHKTT
jgi:homer protein